jgi:MFS family permease
VTTAASTIDRRNVPLYYAFTFAYDFLLWFGIWIKYLIEVRELELRWILAMDLPFWLLVAALQAPMGALADRIGRRRVLIASALLYALTILGFGLTTNYWQLFADYMLWAFAASMRSGTDSALLFDTLQQAGRASEYAKNAGRGFALRVLAGAGAIVLGALLAERIGLARTVQLSALSTVVAAAFAWAMREPAREQVAHDYLGTLRQGLVFTWRDPELRYTVLIGSVLLTAAFGPVVLVQPFLLQHQVATALYGLYQAPLRLIAFVAAMLAFWVQRRARTGSIIVAACVAMVATYLGLAAATAIAAFAFFALPSLVSGLTEPLIGAHLNVRIPSERRATVLSVMPLLFALQAAWFEPAIGFFADVHSLRAAFLFAAAYCLVTMPPLLLLWWRAHARRSATS